jgi:protein-L-isoaspartate(D-aspartate) O-methyltransferase
MVRQQIAARGIRHPGVLAAMERTPRHRFVPQALQDAAYADHPLPIGHHATISQPYIVALMTELLDPSPRLRVLEIGTGSGYQAAVLSPLVAHVFTIELVPELARDSARRLCDLGYTNVTVRHGDGYRGWPEHAPFARILVTAAPPEVPAELVRQLAPGGRLVLPVGQGWDQELVVIEKRSDGRLSRRVVCPVRFVPMLPGESR